MTKSQMHMTGKLKKILFKMLRLQRFMSVRMFSHYVQDVCSLTGMEHKVDMVDILVDILYNYKNKFSEFLIFFRFSDLDFGH